MLQQIKTWMKQSTKFFFFGGGGGGGGGGITGNSFEHKTTKSGHEMPDLAFGYVYTTLNRILLRRHESHTDRASVQA